MDAMKKMERLSRVNFNKPMLVVRHSDLKRADDRSLYRSQCPKCKLGILMMHRTNSCLLSIKDRCLLCGQEVRYTDVKGGRLVGGEVHNALD